jgi:hypothetical protein
MPRIRRWLPLTVFALALAILAAPIAVRAAKEEDDDDDEKIAAAQLSAIGGLSMVTAQQSVLIVGMTADAFSKDVYTPEQVQTFLKATSAQLEAVKALLQKMRDAGLSDEDDASIEKFIDFYGLVEEEAKALDKFVSKRGAAEAKAFEKAREKVLKALDTLSAKEDDDDDKK